MDGNIGNTFIVSSERNCFRGGKSYIVHPAIRYAEIRGASFHMSIFIYFQINALLWPLFRMFKNMRDITTEMLVFRIELKCLKCG